MPDAPKLPASPLAGEPDARLTSSHLQWRRALLVLCCGLTAVGLLNQAQMAWWLIQARTHLASMPQPLVHYVLMGIALYGPALLFGGLGLTVLLGSGPRPSRWGLVVSVLTRVMAALAAVGYYRYAQDQGNPPGCRIPGLVGAAGCALFLVLPFGWRWVLAKLIRGASAAAIMAPVVAMCAVFMNPIAAQAPGLMAHFVLTMIAPVLLLPLVGAAALLWLIVREPDQSQDSEPPEGRHA